MFCSAAVAGDMFVFSTWRGKEKKKVEEMEFYTYAGNFETKFEINYPIK